jgi:hypothetical protein
MQAGLQRRAALESDHVSLEKTELIEPARMSF